MLSYCVLMLSVRGGLLLWQHSHGDVIASLVELLHEVADVLSSECLKSA